MFVNVKRNLSNETKYFMHGLVHKWACESLDSFAYEKKMFLCHFRNFEIDDAQTISSMTNNDGINENKISKIL